MEPQTPEPAALRARIGAVMDSARVQTLITAVIVINAITLGLETSAAVMAVVGGLLTTLDKLILGIFVVELGLKLFAQGLGFFRRPWNIFDTVIVGIALVPSSGAFSVLRALRILRAFRLLSVVPAMRRVVGALLAAIPGVSSVLGLMLLVFYVFAVMATKLYGEAFPHWFGTIGESMYSLFQIMTLESWSMGIVRPVMDVFPYAWLLFVTFILITSFAVLNLFIAVIVNAMHEQHESEAAEAREEMEEIAQREADAVNDQLTALRQEVRELKAMLERSSAG